VLPISQIAATILLSIIASITALIIVGNYAIRPMLEEKIAEAETAIKKGMSALGARGREAREVNKLEKMMISDIMEEYPEIELALDFFSPETADMIREHPERGLKIIQRYKPILDEIIGVRGQQKKQWDF